MAISSIWSRDLQQASFGGIPFVVNRTEATLGRRLATHSYPFRDRPYFEDMGAAPKYYSFDAYLIGDTVHADRKAFERVLDTPGNKTLVHPSRGTMQAMLLNASFLESKEEGRTIECRLTFAVADDRASPFLYPATQPNSSGATIFSALNSVAASVDAFLATVNSYISYGLHIINSILSPIAHVIGAVLGTVHHIIGAITSTIGRFIGLVTSTLGQVLGIFSAVRGIAAIFTGSHVSFGRYSSGHLSRPNLTLASIDQTLPLASRLNMATANVMGVCVSDYTALKTAATDALALPLNQAAFPNAICELVEMSRVAINDPADQISLLSGLANFSPPATVVGSSPIPLAIQQTTLATGALCRRAALVSLARATADYAPTSSTEVETILSQIVPLFDAEIENAADSGDLATYSELRALRTSIIQDLQSRGSQLPALITYQLAANLPSLTLAYRLYQDAARADDLIARADPPNPAFFPKSFVALSA